MSKMPDEKGYLEIQTGIEFETGRKVDGKIEYGRIYNVTSVSKINSDDAILEMNFDYSEITHVKGIIDSTIDANFYFENGTNQQHSTLYISNKSIRHCTNTQNYINRPLKIEIHYLK